MQFLFSNYTVLILCVTVREVVIGKYFRIDILYQRRDLCRPLYNCQIIL